MDNLQEIALKLMDTFLNMFLVYIRYGCSVNEVLSINSIDFTIH